MERTVPSTGSEEIALYLRTFYSLLRTTSEIQIRTLEEAHAGTRSLLHPLARSQTPDLSAFIYSLLRLPSMMDVVKLVILGQSTEAFLQNGIQDVETWDVAEAQARRRRCFYDGQSTLACYIASRSDIDDIIPLLAAFQIEWNKLHHLLNQLPKSFPLENVQDNPALEEDLAQYLQMPVDDLVRLQTLWGGDFATKLSVIAEKNVRIKVRLLDSSLSGYRRATNAWWQGIVSQRPRLVDRPLYFVSSNTHTVVNLLSGFALRHQAELLAFLEQAGSERLQQEWRDIQTSQVPSSPENYLYYLLKNYLATPQGKALNGARLADEKACGIARIPSPHSFDIESQVIELAKLKADLIDPRLQRNDLSLLARSKALIINIDYPLGLAAYNLLTKVSEHNHEILGVYSMGKAATLNGVIGDVMIPSVVHDEHSGNTYLFSNCFSAADVAPYLVYGTVLDNQKAVSVRGTFLQNDRYMDVFYREGYTDIEMEAGPYLSAVYEMHRPNRHPSDEMINLYEIPQDLGFLHYASDTPLSKGKNLGAGSLSYFGVDPTYASALAILGRIIDREIARLSMETH
jgi:hypothetical protein